MLRKAVMQIPIFLSSPTTLSQEQETSRQLIVKELADFGLESRAIGRSDYPSELPLREVLQLARRCSGGVILGFSQFKSSNGGIWKPGSPEEKATTEEVNFPTAWNNLEAGILFSLRLPILVFREPKISGGIFDPGVSDVFIHPMPIGPKASEFGLQARQVILKWQSKVREHYYGS